jgi:cytochrome c553
MKMLLRLVMAVAVLAATFSVFAQQSIPRRRVYTAEQATAGLRELQENKFGACEDCHAKSLSGRNGDKDEIPELSSLVEALQTTVRNNGGRVPQLAGPKFMTKWGARSTKILVWNR